MTSQSIDATRKTARSSRTGRANTKRLMDANEIEIHTMKGHGPRPLIPLGPALTTRPEASSVCSKARSDL
jgi:hypothetical protein